MSKFTFDANKVKPQEALDPIPGGWYLANITNTDLKPTKSDPSGGTRLEIEFTIVEGEFKGRKIFDGFNLKNKNPVAADIGQQQLSAVCHATGVFKFTDTKELHDKTLQLKVGLEGERTVGEGKTAQTYEARNVYKGCKPLDGAANGGPTTPVTGGTSLPWKKDETTPAAGVKTPPKSPGKTPPPKKEAVLVWQPKEGIEGPFWAVIGDDTEGKEVSELLEMLGKGMPLDTAVMLQSEEEWKTAGDYFEQVEEGAAEPAPAAEAAAPKGPPAKPAAAGKNNPPWAKK